jgi:hypothetical protein
MILRFTIDHRRASRVVGTWILARRLPSDIGRMVLTHPEEIVGASFNDVRGIAAHGKVSSPQVPQDEVSSLH